MLSPADLVEKLLEAGNPAEETLKLLAADAEVRPFGSEQVLRGLPEIERYAAAGQNILGQPSVESATLYEVGENALVLTLLGVTRSAAKAASPRWWRSGGSSRSGRAGSRASTRIRAGRRPRKPPG